MDNGKEGQDSIELEHLSRSLDDADDAGYGRKRRLSSFSDDDSDDATEGTGELYSPIEERAVIRKLDRRLVLFVALLYMLSFLDRSSKSN